MFNVSKPGEAEHGMSEGIERHRHGAADTPETGAPPAPRMAGHRHQKVLAVVAIASAVAVWVVFPPGQDRQVTFEYMLVPLFSIALGAFGGVMWGLAERSDERD